MGTLAGDIFALPFEHGLEPDCESPGAAGVTAAASLAVPIARAASA